MNETGPGDTTEAAVKVHREGPVFVITLDRPRQFHALHRAAHQSLSEIFDEFERDDSLRVAIITGGGDRAFCVGNDIRQTFDGNDMGTPPTGFAGLTSRFERTKPVIAAVNGLALGGGFEIVLACDIVIASEGARFALPEPRVGVMALAGGIQNLVRNIPLKQAMGMILTGLPVNAQDGFRMGFVNQVVALDELMDTARSWAQNIVECAPLAIAGSMAAVNAARGLAGQEALSAQNACEGVKRMNRSEDRREGMRAFAEKRKPNWSGR